MNYILDLLFRKIDFGDEPACCSHPASLLVELYYLLTNFTKSYYGLDISFHLK
jgi:hypothetical protein